jgi:hypothetical protein
VDSDRGLTRRGFLNKAAKVGAVTWTVPTLMSIPLAHAQAGSHPPPPPNGNGNQKTNTNVLGSGGNSSVLGSRIEAQSETLGATGVLPATGPSVDIPNAAAAAAGLLTTGAALSKMGKRRMRRYGADPVAGSVEQNQAEA